MNTERGVFPTFQSWLDAAITVFPDNRTKEDCEYEIRDAAIGAFSIFHMQCRSFLEHQKWLDEHKGSHNVLSIYGVEKIPTDTHIKRLLDPVPANNLFPIYLDALTWLKNEHPKTLNSMRHVENTYLTALDGTDFFSSSTIHCEQCSVKEHKNGTINYSHKAITPALVRPAFRQVIPLPQEFIEPQDGHLKQDCENAAAKRWISQYGGLFGDWGMTLLGDDLYSRQPVCESALIAKCHFIFVCKDISHKYLTEWVQSAEIGKDITGIKRKHWTGKRREYHIYRYMNNVPIREGDDALRVNWAELEILDENGKRLHRFVYITDIPITNSNITQIIDAGRCRWKIENENNNILKKRGYHIEHNFGHGKQNLANFLLCLNILAFLCHTLQHLFDKRYELLRNRLSSRRRFFTDIIALTTYSVFDGWDHLMKFMLKGLELDDPGG